MNNTRRRGINELKTQIDFVNKQLKEASKKLSFILNEEQDAFDNMHKSRSLKGLRLFYVRMASIMKYPRIYEISINVCNLEKR